MIFGHISVTNNGIPMYFGQNIHKNRDGMNILTKVQKCILEYYCLLQKYDQKSHMPNISKCSVYTTCIVFFCNHEVVSFGYDLILSLGLFYF